MTDEQRVKRLHYHMYESLEGIQENAERIVKLEELVTALEWCSCFSCISDDGVCPLYKSDATGDERYGCETLKRELGIEVTL